MGFFKDRRRYPCHNCARAIQIRRDSLKAKLLTLLAWLSDFIDGLQ